MSKLQERLIIIVILSVTLLSAFAAMLLVTAYDITISVPGLASNGQHYSKPITVLSHSAPGQNGRNAFVKMTFIASSGKRATAGKIADQESTVKSSINSVLNRHSPEALLQPSALDEIQIEIAETLSRELGLSIEYIYFDRITIQ